MGVLFEAANDPLSSPLKASPPPFALEACFGVDTLCSELGVIERELGFEDLADESSVKTSCCGRLLVIVDAVPSFCGWGLEGAEELQRSANESDIGSSPACYQYHFVR